MPFASLYAAYQGYKTGELIVLAVLTIAVIILLFVGFTYESVGSVVSAAVIGYLIYFYNVNIIANYDSDQKPLSEE